MEIQMIELCKRAVMESWLEFRRDQMNNEPFFERFFFNQNKVEVTEK